MEEHISLYDLSKPELIEKVLPLIQKDKKAEIARLEKQVEILLNSTRKSLHEQFERYGFNPCFINKCVVCEMYFIEDSRFLKISSYCFNTDQWYHKTCKRPCHCINGCR